MRTHLMKIAGKRTKASGGLMVPMMVAALLMAAALVGCNTAGGDPVTREGVTGLPTHAEAVGQDNGSLTDTFPTAGDYQRPVAFRPVDRTPRVDERHGYGER